VVFCLLGEGGLQECLAISRFRGGENTVRYGGIQLQIPARCPLVSRLEPHSHSHARAETHHEPRRGTLTRAPTSHTHNLHSDKSLLTSASHPGMSMVRSLLSSPLRGSGDGGGAKLRDFGGGCNLYRSGAKVFTPTRCRYVRIQLHTVELGLGGVNRSASARFVKVLTVAG